MDDEKGNIVTAENSEMEDSDDPEKFATLEKLFEETLEKKAALKKLSVKNVKSFLRELVTNEYVLGMLTQKDTEFNYEPKCTRAKAKALGLSSVNIPSTSETVQLLSEDIQDDSDEEYVPEKELLTNVQQPPDNTIALRTRSKLNLHDTPLEELEKTLIPPDISTDMYDMQCADEPWAEFLTRFTMPIDEVVKPTDDEDMDPEYNIMADDDIEDSDKEELRSDRAVRVSKKEVNALMSELYEFAHNNHELHEKQIQEEQTALLKQSCTALSNPAQSSQEENIPMKLIYTSGTPTPWNIPEENGDESNLQILSGQVPLLMQQMCQHVQLITTHFLLAYRHPEFHQYSETYAELLQDLEKRRKESIMDANSTYATPNLQSAIALVATWKHLINSNSATAAEHQWSVQNNIMELMNSKFTGVEYIPNFSPVLRSFVLNSNVFIYPHILPRIPYKPRAMNSHKRCVLSYFELNLMALFMEKTQGNMGLEDLSNKVKTLANTLHQEVMPWYSTRQIYTSINKFRKRDAKDNPIQYFFIHGKAPPITQYISPLTSNDLLPLACKSSNVLPLLWRENVLEVTVTGMCPGIAMVTNARTAERTIQDTRSRNNFFGKNEIRFKVGDQDVIINTIPNFAYNDFSSNLQPITSNILNNAESQVLPERIIQMKEIQDKTEISIVPNNKHEDHPNNAIVMEMCSSEQILQLQENIVNQNNADDVITDCLKEEIKDNLDDITKLMVASATVKKARKMPGGAEKKRAKVQKAFISNLNMVASESNENIIRKTDNFSQNYMNKLAEVMKKDDYTDLLRIMQKFNESSDDFKSFYTDIESVFNRNEIYKQIADEFLVLLTDTQAYSIGKLMEHYYMVQLSHFLSKLYIYFKDQSSHIKKIFKCLTELSEMDNLTMAQIRETVTPLFKGNVALTDWFFQMFSDERPPRVKLQDGTFETIDLSKESTRMPDEHSFETITVTNSEDKYGGHSCICVCHLNKSNNQFKTRALHCLRCGLKFIHGKIFIQTGRGPKPALVSFLSNTTTDHMKRLNAPPKQSSKHLHNSPINQESSAESPSKDELDNCVGTSRYLGNTDSEKEEKVHPKRKRKLVAPTISLSNKNASTQDGAKENTDTCSKGKKRSIELKEDNQKTLKRTNKVSTDLANNHEECQTISWARREDQIILESFKQRDPETTEAEVFQVIADQLTNRTSQEVKKRFHYLLDLLLQMEGS